MKGRLQTLLWRPSGALGGLGRGAALALALGLAGCGGYPQPLAGHPGVLGARLALPPPPRLVIAPPDDALLPDADAAAYAGDLAASLTDREVPAYAARPTKADWRLLVRAAVQRYPDGSQWVIARYTVLNPRGVAQGSVEAKPISFETWAQAEPVALKVVADRDAPAIAGLLTSIRAATELSDPDSLVNRAPRIVLVGVTGAPGDGDRSLAAGMATQLANLGIVVQSTAADADYTVAGRVSLTPDPPGNSRVEIDWVVMDQQGRQAGHLAQINDVPEGSLDRAWGDVADVITEQAAGGVREVMLNQTQAHRLGHAS